MNDTPPDPPQLDPDDQPSPGPNLTLIYSLIALALAAAIGLAMLIGRFLMIVPIMGLAGSLAGKKVSPPSAGTFPVSGLTFVVLLLGTVLLVGALNFLPALALGPIIEHFLNAQGKLY